MFPRSTGVVELFSSVVLSCGCGQPGIYNEDLGGTHLSPQKTRPEKVRLLCTLSRGIDEQKTILLVISFSFMRVSGAAEG